MLVIGDNLKELCHQYGLVDRKSSYDINSLTLRLHPVIINISTQSVVDYGKPLLPEWCKEEQMPQQGIELKKNTGVLCCTEETISMPKGYFGLVQTKGSLARLFISVTCSDGQVEPGFTGRITLELVNLGHLKIRIPPLSPVAQLFVFKASTKNVTGYDGRYQGARLPTIYKPQ